MYVLSKLNEWCSQCADAPQYLLYDPRCDNSRKVRAPRCVSVSGAPLISLDKTYVEQTSSPTNRQRIPACSGRLAVMGTLLQPCILFGPHNPDTLGNTRLHAISRTFVTSKPMHYMHTYCTYSTVCTPCTVCIMYTYTVNSL